MGTGRHVKASTDIQKSATSAPPFHFLALLFIFLSSSTSSSSSAVPLRPSFPLLAAFSTLLMLSNLCELILDTVGC